MDHMPLVADEAKDIVEYVCGYVDKLKARRAAETHQIFRTSVKLNAFGHP
jgi:hypothetical protein